MSWDSEDEIEAARLVIKRKKAAKQFATKQRHSNKAEKPKRFEKAKPAKNPAKENDSASRERFEKYFHFEY